MINLFKNHHLETIGQNAIISIEGIENIPAKIDTGADSSAIHAENISASKGILSFEIFNKKITTKNFKIVNVRSSNGISENRYCVTLNLELGGKAFKTVFTLADRSKNTFPVLIGKRAIRNRFIVDVSQTEINSSELKNEMKNKQEEK